MSNKCSLFEGKQEMEDDAQNIVKKGVRRTTSALMEHIPFNLALFVESFIMDERECGEVFYTDDGCEYVINDSDKFHLSSDAAAGHWEIALSYYSKDELENSFMGACAGGHMELATYLISCGACDFNGGLCGAISTRNIEMIHFMKKCGADMNCGLLFHVSANNTVSIDICKLLIDLGATDLSGLLNMGAITSKFAIVALALSYGVQISDMSIISAGIGGDWGIILLFVHLRGEANYFGSLIGASISGNLRIVRRIIEYNHGHYFLPHSLKYACMNKGTMPGQYQVIKYLIECGASVCPHCNRSMAEHTAEADMFLSGARD